MNVTEFLKVCPTGVSAPVELLDLLRFENLEGIENSRSSDFGLRPFGYEIAVHYFGDQELGQRFLVFGGDSGGGVYSFWLYEGRNLRNAPIVYFGSEGERFAVLANSIKDFFRLLMLGIEEVGYNAEVSNWQKFVSETPAINGFREWAYERYGLSIPSNPIEIISSARGKHPDFEMWLIEKGGLRP